MEKQPEKKEKFSLLDEELKSVEVELNELENSTSTEEKDLLSAMGKVQTPEEKEGKPNRTLPEMKNVTRAVVLQTPDFQRGLFEELEEVNVSKEKGIIIKTNIHSLISPEVFSACMWGLKASLYDQSYLHHNDKELAGAFVKGNEVRDKKGNVIHKGVYGMLHKVRLNDICKYGYGDYNAGMRVKMDKALDILDKNKILIKYGDKDHQKEKETYLVKILSRDYDPTDNSVCYDLTLNPIFTDQSQGYGKILGETMPRLSDFLKSRQKRKGDEYYKFFELLAIQKDTTMRRSLANLLNDLNLYNYYKKNPKRLKERLQLLFESAVETGYLVEVPDPLIPPDGIYNFKINPALKSTGSKRGIKNKGEDS